MYASLQKQSFELLKMWKGVRLHHSINGSYSLFFSSPSVVPNFWSVLGSIFLNSKLLKCSWWYIFCCDTSSQSIPSMFNWIVTWWICLPVDTFYSHVFKSVIDDFRTIETSIIVHNSRFVLLVVLLHMKEQFVIESRILLGMKNFVLCPRMSNCQSITTLTLLFW